MKRDMELVRKLLMELADSEFYSDMGLPRLDGYEEDKIRHHALIMRDAGLLTFTEGDETVGMFGIQEDLQLRLTWAGHEFLEKARDEKTWRSVVNKTKEKTGGLSFEIIQGLLIAALSKAAGIA
jgi:hypothetical protein